ncbi:MAG: DNA/RNA non-specific endonuclease [Pseudolabrys sp.]
MPHKICAVAQQQGQDARLGDRAPHGHADIGQDLPPEGEIQTGPRRAADKRAVDDDYRNSKSDRGHQAPSDDFKHRREWMVESFFLSNVVPQVGIAFNRGIWKNLEDHVRDRGELYAITGPSDREQTGSGTLTITDTTNVCRNKIVLKPLKRESICGAKAKSIQDHLSSPPAPGQCVHSAEHQSPRCRQGFRGTHRISQEIPGHRPGGGEIHGSRVFPRPVAAQSASDPRAVHVLHGVLGPARTALCGSATRRTAHAPRCADTRGRDSRRLGL